MFTLRKHIIYLFWLKWNDSCIINRICNILVPHWYHISTSIIVKTYFLYTPSISVDTITKIPILRKQIRIKSNYYHFIERYDHRVNFAGKVLKFCSIQHHITLYIIFIIFLIDFLKPFHFDIVCTTYLTFDSIYSLEFGLIRRLFDYEYWYFATIYLYFFSLKRSSSL